MDTAVSRSHYAWLALTAWRTSGDEEPARVVGYPRSTTESSFTKKNRLGRDRGVNVLGADLNRTIPGLFEHCKRGDKAIFPDVQGWIRIRADSTLVERGA